MTIAIDRRRLLLAGATGLLPGWALSGSAGLAATPPLSGEDIHLSVGHSRFETGGRSGHAITVNGTLPGPLIRLKEGQTVRIHVRNTLSGEDTSIHWHGLLLPHTMDGVPGLSFPGIRPREQFTYEFPVRQSGTYWYHSHTGLQEQSGLYGPIVIDPAGPDPNPFDREHVIVLSDWTFLHPHTLISRLKAEGGYFNRQRQTLLSGDMPMAGRRMWAAMRMDPTDIADVTAATYSYLLNGHGPRENWTGLFTPQQRVRLRLINASAMTIFNVRIPGLKLLVVAADGQDVRPTEVEELQIGNAETYDLIVVPDDRAYAVVAESIDRSGMAVGTLAPRPGMRATPPPLRPRPTLTMRDMGMGGMAETGGHGEHGDHGGHANAGGNAGGHGGGHSGHMPMRDKSMAPPQIEMGVGVDMIASNPVDRTGEPGLGLADVGHKVLTYRDLMALTPNPDQRPPTRTVEVHLTGNMERFMWSFDGRKYSDGVDPIRFARDERARVVLVNHTMMTHPIHLHGHFFELVNGHTGSLPRKHTVNVLPGGKVTFDFTADAPGDWAFHCHLLLHMHAGMFRVVSVRPLDGATA